MNWKVGLIVIFAVFIFLGFIVNGQPDDIQINMEYTNGILTATGILFGIWAVVLGTNPKPIINKRDTTKKSIFKNNVKELKDVKEPFFASLLFLVMDVICLALTAVNVFSPHVTLLIVTTSFIYTALFLAMTLNYYIFED
jgi:hypothetical protein